MDKRTEHILRKLRNPSPKDFWWGESGLFAAAADEVQRLAERVAFLEDELGL